MLIIVSAVLAFLLDRASKILILRYALDVAYPSEAGFGATVPIIEDVFHLTFYGNTGMAFGMLAGNKALLICLCMVILAIIAFVAIKFKVKNRLEAISIGMIVGGAVGNVLDRLLYGFVIDYFDFCLINYPIFNVADCCIVVGAILFCIYIIFLDKREDKLGKN